METAGANYLVPIVVAIIGSQGIIVAALIAMAWRIGRTPTYNDTREITNEAKQEVKAEIAQTRQEVKAEIAQTRQEVLQEMRRNNQQLLLALANHTHPSEDGQAVFALPPEMEPTAADD